MTSSRRTKGRCGFWQPAAQRVEVRQNLIKAEFDGDTIDRVVDRLTGVALIDDAAFVRYWLDNRAQFNPRGQVALRQELRRKGVDRAVIDEVLRVAAVDQSDDQAAIRSALAKAIGSANFRRPSSRKS